MLWRLLAAAAPRLLPGVALKETSVPRALLKTITFDRLTGGVNTTLVQCAWDMLATVARVRASVNATGPRTLTVPAVVARLQDLGLAEAQTGTTVAALAAAALDQPLALQVLPALLEKKAPVDKADAAGVRPLGHASRQGHAEVVRLLLDSKVAAEAQPAGSQQQPLHLAAANGHQAVAKLLLERGAKKETKDAQGRAPKQVVPLRDANMS